MAKCATKRRMSHTSRASSCVDISRVRASTCPANAAHREESVRPPCGLGCGGWGLGFGVWGLGFGVWCLGLRD